MTHLATHVAEPLDKKPPYRFGLRSTVVVENTIAVIRLRSRRAWQAEPRDRLEAGSRATLSKRWYRESELTHYDDPITTSIVNTWRHATRDALDVAEAIRSLT